MTPTPEQMEKLKHATGWGESIISGQVPGWRKHYAGTNADCDALCELGLMRFINPSSVFPSGGYSVTEAGLSLVLAEWAKVTKFTVLFVHDPRPAVIVAETAAKARAKVAREIEASWCISFVKACRYIKSVRKVRP